MIRHKLLLTLMLASHSTGTSLAAEPLFIGHRGASENAPENTLASFRMAWDEGADGIEGDFQLTADGEVVCIHDPDTKRVAGKKRVIAKTTWAELSTLDIGSWKDPRFAGEKIPRLDDVLNVLKPGKMFFLEIKSGLPTVDPVAKILARHKADPTRVILICFDAAVIASCREKMPQFQAHLISGLKGADSAKKAATYQAELAACHATGLQFDSRTSATTGWLAGLKLPLASWTVNDVKTARKVIGLGVTYITTNRPGKLRQELAGSK